MAKGRSPLVPLNSQKQQSAAERRQLRGSYRQLHAQALAGKENIVNGGSDLQDLFVRADALHAKAERPREHAVDAEVFAELAQCGLAMIKQGQAVNTGRMPADLVRALRGTFLVDPMTAYNPQLSPHDFDWAGLGATVSGLHRTVPGVSCLLGPLEAEAKARKAVVRQPRQPVEALTRPQELDSIQDLQDKQETDRNYEKMWRVLRTSVGFDQQVPLIALVLNHSSFAQTVENIFTLSFLVRDGRVRLLADSQKGVLVAPVSDEQKAAAHQQGQGKVLQFLMSFTMQDWVDMKQLVPAANCIMPHRGSAGSRGRPEAEATQQVKRARRG